MKKEKAPNPAGLGTFSLVGVAGFEPAASWSRIKEIPFFIFS
jgi:hypothetical protein